MFSFRPVSKADIEQLVALEQQCFQSDQISARSFKRFIKQNKHIFIGAYQKNELLGYALTLHHQGTRLARLYSVAISDRARGQGIAQQLLALSEQQALERGALFYRLEVNPANQAAISLYQKLGFKVFGQLKDYYQDGSDALRMQKLLHKQRDVTKQQAMMWLQQRTEFTCGPTALLMALHSINAMQSIDLSEELDIWREATTIFMTSGHGGCHPIGLALAAEKRGYQAHVWINHQQPLFVDGVRQSHKKAIIENVHHHFVEQANQKQLPIHYSNISQTEMIALFDQGYRILVLISTYRFDNKKAPHWVVMSGYDQQCLFVHDPDIDEHLQDAFDCQFVPISWQDFERMSQFGQSRMRTVVAIN